MSMLSIRAATVDDVDVVTELRLALLREHGENAIYRRLRRDAEQKARPLYAAQLRSTQEVIFLAERGGETVGILRCVDTLGSPLLDPSRYGYVSSVYVRPVARRRGVLRALLEEAERWARGRGLTELRLHNAADNELAVAAWGELGFEIVEQLRLRPISPAAGAAEAERRATRARGPRLADEGGGSRWR
jgi:ribosomal protein S18 acetylase RimI-like enzyme